MFGLCWVIDARAGIDRGVRGRAVVDDPLEACGAAIRTDDGVIGADHRSCEVAGGVGIRNVAACRQSDLGQAARLEAGVARRVFVSKGVLGVRIGGGVPIWKVDFAD